VPTHNHVWKRRLRNAPSAQSSDKEIILAVVWKTKENEDARPTATVRKDPLLWSIWVMKTEWTYVVYTKNTFGGQGDPIEFSSEKDALAEYRKRVKDFPRSKEVDYGFPVD
jgi:hypothetical protein